jgi:hypothetical protein
LRAGPAHVGPGDQPLTTSLAQVRAQRVAQLEELARLLVRSLLHHRENRAEYRAFLTAVEDEQYLVIDCLRDRYAIERRRPPMRYPRSFCAKGRGISTIFSFVRTRRV